MLHKQMLLHCHKQSIDVAQAEMFLHCHEQSIDVAQAEMFLHFHKQSVDVAHANDHVAHFYKHFVQASPCVMHTKSTVTSNNEHQFKYHHDVRN
jgi:hypothetical protein